MSRSAGSRGPAALLAGLAVVVALAAACSADAGAHSTDEPLLVAAASDLQPAFTALGEQFAAETGAQVTFSFGSSGQLAQQALEGAPFDLFASADAGYVEQVLAGGRGDAATRSTYAFGRIAIWARADAWGGWASLDDVVADAGVTTLAIANPEHAPYGLAARQALETAGLWERARPRLVYGENVTDTQRLAASGNADAAVVALSLALAADEQGTGRWRLVPEDAHAPLQQELVVTAEDPARAALAARFVAHVSSTEGRAVMRRYGFWLPGDEPPTAWEG